VPQAEHLPIKIFLKIRRTKLNSFPSLDNWKKLTTLKEFLMIKSKELWKDLSPILKDQNGEKMLKLE
jgi:hypothetical protein